MSDFIPQFKPVWDDDERTAVNDLLSGDAFILEHVKTREFEREFAKFCNAKHCITVTSGTIALYLAYMALRKLQTDVDRRIPSLHSIFAHNAMIQAYLQPVIVDCDKNGSTSTNDETLVIHNNGRRGHSFSPIEDCCQALGLHTKNKISCYSFASSKHLTTLGQGGAICCDDDEQFDILCRLKDHGRNDRQEGRPMSDSFPDWGTNFKFTEAAAVFGLQQLKKLPMRQKRLLEIWNIYNDELGRYVNFLDTPPTWYIDIFIDKPEQLLNFLKTKNIGSRLYPKPTYRHDVYKIPTMTDWAEPVIEFQNAEYFSKYGLYLPSTTSLTDEQVLRICSEIKRFFSAP